MKTAYMRLFHRPENPMKPITTRLALPLFASFSMALAATVHGQSTWNGSNTNWSTSTSWTPNGVPADGANVIIADSTANGISLDGGVSRSIGSLTFGATGTRTGNFTVNTQASNTLTIKGGVIASGNFQPTTNLTMRGNYVVPTDQTWAVGGSSADDKDQGVFIREVAAGAENRGRLTLDANLTKIGTGQFQFAAMDLLGAGNLIVNDGDLKLNAGASQPLVVGGTGNITVNNAATLAIYKNSGTLLLTRPIVMNGTSKLNLRNAGLEVAAPIAFNGTHTLSQVGTATVTGAWSGSGIVNRSGIGTLKLNGNMSGFTGTLNLSEGETNLGGPFGGSINQTAGTLAGEVAVAGSLSLGGGTLRVNPNTPASLGTAGNLNLSGVTTIVLTENPSLAAPFPVFTYGGTLTGDASNLALLGGTENYRTPTFSTATLGTITLAVGSEVRTWNGGAAWDVATSPNWLEGDKKFYQLDKVRFGDTGAGSVALTGVLLPSSITVDSTNDYVFTAEVGNSIAGGTGVIKAGSGTLKLGGVNTFTGNIAINGGTLAPTGIAALGAIGNTITIAAGAALDVNSSMNSARDYKAVIAGDGPSGLGAIVNETGAGHTNGFGTIRLAADATIGGLFRYDLRPIVAGTGVLDLAGFTLTKTGSNTIAIVDSVATAAGDITINDGVLSLTRTTLSGTGAVNVNMFSTLRFENSTTGSFSKKLNVTDATVWTSGAPFIVNGPVTISGYTTFRNEANLTLADTVTGDANSNISLTFNSTLILAGTTTVGSIDITSGSLQIGNGGTTGSYAGPIFNNGQVIFNRSDALTYGESITGIGGLIKEGAGTLTLTGENFYTGNTAVNGGVLSLGGDHRIDAASNLVLGNIIGATLDLNGHNQEFRSLSGGGIAGGNIVNSGSGSSILTARPVAGDSITFSGKIQGDIRVAVVGSKTEPSFSAPRQRLAGTENTYTGGTLVDGATLLARLDGSLGAVPAAFDPDNITLQNGGTLFNEADNNTLTLNANRGIVVGSGGGAMLAGFNGRVTVQGVISGAAGNDLTILANNSTFVMTGENTYLGNTIMPPPSPGYVSRLQIGDGGTTGSLASPNVINNGELSFNRSNDHTFAATISGVGSVTQLGLGNVTLTAVNTYTGNTNVNDGSLTLADNAGLSFLVTDEASNKIGGFGTLQLNGDFTIDTASVTANSGTWTLVDTETLNATFGSTFTVKGAGWTETANVWTRMDGAKTWTFTEANGILTLSGGGAAFADWMGGYDFSAFPGADLSAAGDADGDGIANAIEFVIGNAPNASKVENLPTIQRVTNPAGVPAGEYLKFSYRRTTASVAAEAISAVQYDTDLVGTWTTAVNGTDGVFIMETADGAIPGDIVDVYLPKSLEAGGKLFTRLSVVVP